MDEACSDCLVPPLVLQPLIENAVKHGIATMVEGGTIRVEGHVVDGSAGSERRERIRSRIRLRRAGTAWACATSAAAWKRASATRRA